MASLTDTVVTNQYADRSMGVNFEWWQYTIDCGTTGDEWSLVTLLVPSNILDGFVESAVLFTLPPAATIRALGAIRERASLRIRYGGQINAPSLAPFFAVSEEIANWSENDPANEQVWIAEFKNLPRVHITRNDQLQLSFPPVDGNSTPTADARLHLGVSVEKYTKR